MNCLTIASIINLILAALIPCFLDPHTTGTNISSGLLTGLGALGLLGQNLNETITQAFGFAAFNFAIALTLFLALGDKIHTEPFSFIEAVIIGSSFQALNMACVMAAHETTDAEEE